jgi:hypothetical protein
MASGPGQAVLGWFPVSMALQGRPDLDQPTMLARRDDFVRQALAALPRALR